MAEKIGAGELCVKKILKERGIKMKELAVEIGITPESLTRALQGNPQYLTLKKIADYLGVSVRDLFEDGDVKRNANNEIKGCIFTNDKAFTFNCRTEFEDFIINQANGFVRIPTFPREDILKNSVKDFCVRSIESNTSGAIMNRYGAYEAFTLSYDSDSKKFSLTLCIGDGNVKFKLFDTAEYKKEDSFTSQEMNRMVEDILSCIESIYVDRVVDAENHRVRLINLE